uniref:Uncharacterized protein LOC105059083 isoform X4 n=1 Tax=Elaeis guineensis var. tenera TaxID=51953 RepID=A0A6J0PDM0_ELAGV|nr:uncharacterized protein LOC105059083 isoform X4 [Elaeis guineensis]
MGLAFNLVQRGVDWLVLASLAIRLPTTVWKRFPPPDPIQIEGGGDHAAGVLEGIRNGAHATEGSYLLVEMALQTVACSQMTNPIPFLRRPLPLLSLSAAPVQTPSTLDPHPLTTPSQKKYICMEFQVLPLAVSGSCYHQFDGGFYLFEEIRLIFRAFFRRAYESERQSNLEKPSSAILGISNNCIRLRHRLGNLRRTRELKKCLSL